MKDLIHPLQQVLSVIARDSSNEVARVSLDPLEEGVIKFRRNDRPEMGTIRFSERDGKVKVTGERGGSKKVFGEQFGCDDPIQLVDKEIDDWVKSK